MAKYTLNTYGWSFEAICKTLTHEQVQLIRDKMEEEGFSELHEIRFELDELLDLDFWDGEVLHKTEAFDNGAMHFELLDEEENKVLEFGINDVGDLYETIEDYDDKYEYRGYEVIPEYNVPPTNLYLSVDENKGGIFKFEFESDTVPTPLDFTYSSGSIGIYIAACTSSALTFNTAYYDLEIYYPVPGNPVCPITTRLLEGQIRLSQQVTI